MTASPARGARGAPRMSVTVAGIQLKNPVIAASGTFGYGIEFEDVVHLDKLGGFVVKGLKDFRLRTERIMSEYGGRRHTVWQRPATAG